MTTPQRTHVISAKEFLRTARLFLDGENYNSLKLAVLFIRKAKIQIAMAELYEGKEVT